MNYTDNQLKAALAKMLPKQTKLANFFWHVDERGCLTRQIEDTELLHLCWLVEETINDGGVWKCYCNRLWEVVCPQFEQMSGLNAAIALLLLHATWQQRVIALAKVKEIEI